MSKIHSMMDIGKRSMMNSQTALQTVSHNIANKTTEGYSRQRVESVAADPITEGRIQVGMGVRPAQVSRITNPALDRQLQVESGKMGFEDARAESLGRVEQVFNEQQYKGINQYMSDFFNSWRELSNSPESVTGRTLVKESGQALVEEFQRVHNQLSDIQKDIDGQVEMHVSEINKMTKEIADLNEKISSVENQGIPANDQRDRRDLLLKKLNEKIEIKFAEGDHGSVTVSAAGNAILVAGFENKDLHTAKDPDTQHSIVYFKESEKGENQNITDRIRSGAIGGILQIRDKVIEDLHDGIDNLAVGIAENVNNVHAQGLDRKSRPAGQFFEIDLDADHPAKGISLSKEITNDITRIASAARDKSPGDNAVSHVIANLQYKEILDDGTSTIDDYYASNIGKVGILAQGANKSRETQQGVVQQLNTLRDSVSGVSLDEETIKMIEHQKAFDASARVIRAADEMFDTVLNIKRL